MQYTAETTVRAQVSEGSSRTKVRQITRFALTANLQLLHWLAVGPIFTVISPATGCCTDFMYGAAGIVQSLATELRSGPSSDPSQIVENSEEMLAVRPTKALHHVSRLHHATVKLI
eukprot:COSAG02_NODE_468_length_21758_cov_41.206796_3_plen_116_part_00